MPKSSSSGDVLSEASSRRVWLTLLLLLALALSVAYYVIVNEDRDFRRPVRPLQCEGPPPFEKPFRFVVFGDWGSGTAFQMALARQMAATYRQTPFSEVFLLGDNIYESGDVKRLGHDFFEVPYGPLLKKNVHFRAALGNHDIRQNHAQAQMEYFKMPADYYRLSERGADFFILNTNTFFKNRQQQAWLANALSKSRARWKIVLGHHPLYSSGRHGETESLRRVLEPILLKGGADVYLAGHDHDYERFAPIHGIRYIVSGGGGAFLTDFRKPKPYSKVRLRTHHFLLFEMLGSSLWMKTVNRFGDVVDCTSWQKSASGLAL